MGDHPATWKCRRSPGASDGQRCHTVVEIRLTSRTIGSLRLGPAQVSDGSQRQGRQARRARLHCCQARSGDPHCRGARDPALRHRHAARRLRLGHEAVHGQMVTHGTPPMRPATLLAHSGTTDPCGRHVSQHDNDGAAARHGIAGPSDPGKGRECPTPSLSPVRHAGLDHRAVPARLNRRPGRAPQDRLREQPLAHPLAEMVERERPAALDRDLQALPHDPIRRCRLLGVVGRAAEEPTSSGGEQQDRAATQKPTAHPAVG